MKITEIEIDDSQTGYCWIQIFTSGRKQATSLKHQILDDQAIRERLENEIIQSQKIAAQSSTPPPLARLSKMFTKRTMHTGMLLETKILLI